eukprot:193197-Pelagomonas_calceolata.AAC.2
MATGSACLADLAIPSTPDHLIWTYDLGKCTSPNKELQSGSLEAHKRAACTALSLCTLTN